MIISGAALLGAFGMVKSFLGGGVLLRWLKPLLNPRVWAMIGLAWMIAMWMGKREGSRVAGLECDIKSKEAVAIAVKAVNDRNLAAQAAADAAEQEGLKEVEDLRAVLSRKEDELRDALSKSQNPNCNWTVDELERLRGSKD